MVMFGKEIEPFHQQCAAHTIHWTVCDVLYSKTSEVVFEDADKQADNVEELVHAEEDLDLLSSTFNFEKNGQNE